MKSNDRKHNVCDIFTFHERKIIQNALRQNADHKQYLLGRLGDGTFIVESEAKRDELSIAVKQLRWLIDTFGAENEKV